MDEALTELLREMFASPGPLSIFVTAYIGLVVGSFLNVVIYRLPLQRSVVMPGSACGACGTPLRLQNNIPVFSYLWQRGLCQYCGAPFSIRYLSIELACGLVSVGLLYFDQGVGWHWLFHFTLFALALAVFFTDLDHWIIPDEVNLFGVIFGCAIASFLPPRGDMDVIEEVMAMPLEFMGWSFRTNFWGSVLGVCVGVGFFRFIQFLGMLFARQEAMGDGDVKYAAVLGAFLGWQMALAAFFLSFFLGAVYAVPLLMTAKGRGKDPVPFGTFMSLAAVPVSLWGGWMYERLFDLGFVV